VEAARIAFERLDWQRVEEMLKTKEPESLHLDYISAAGYSSLLSPLPKSVGFSFEARSSSRATA